MGCINSVPAAEPTGESGRDKEPLPAATQAPLATSPSAPAPTPASAPTPAADAVDQAAPALTSVDAAADTMAKVVPDEYEQGVFNAESFRAELLSKCTYDADLEAEQRRQQADGLVLGISLHGIEFGIGNAWANQKRQTFEEAKAWFGGEVFDNEEMVTSEEGESYPVWFGADPETPLRRPNTTLSFRAEHQMSLQGKDGSAVSPLTSRIPVPWMVKNLIKPITEERQCPLLELFFGLRFGWNHLQLVAPCNTFVSYTWMSSYNSVLRAALQSLPHNVNSDGCYVWWDIYCQNQHVMGDVKKTFSLAIAQIEHFLFVVPEMHNPAALGRIWCLFELAFAVSNKRNLHLAAMNMDNDPKLFEKVQTKHWTEAVIDVRTAQATRSEDIDLVMGLVRELVEGGPDGLNETVRDVFGQMWSSKILLASASFGDLAGVRRALSEGADVGFVTQDGWSALWLVSFNYAGPDARELLQLLLEHDKDADGGRQKRLHHALESAKTGEVVDLLVAAGADVSAEHRFMHNNLNKPDVIRSLIKHGADINVLNLAGDTPLSVAKQSHEETARILEEAGAKETV
eukprot:m.481098 g.481098  ORF g.481098 m.481098 type:complete len:572 (+) comp22045_c0_seq1:1382-3097(+)